VKFEINQKFFAEFDSNVIIEAQDQEQAIEIFKDGDYDKDMYTENCLCVLEHGPIRIKECD